MYFSDLFYFQSVSVVLAKSCEFLHLHHFPTLKTFDFSPREGGLLEEIVRLTEQHLGILVYW